MKRTLTALSIAAALALTGCSGSTEAADAPSSAAVTSESAATAPATTDAAATSAAAPATPQSPEDVLAALTVDVTKSREFTYDDGLKISFNSAKVAAPEQVGSDPVAGSDAVILSFTYTNGSAETIPLQAVPLTVFYGVDMYDADSPTPYEGDTTKTELPKQIAPGSTVEVVNTYWIPAGEVVTVQVDVSGSADMERPLPTFEGIMPGM